MINFIISQEYTSSIHKISREKNKRGYQTWGSVEVYSNFYDEN
jgi:hypothetical protein